MKKKQNHLNYNFKMKRMNIKVKKINLLKIFIFLI